MATAKSLLEGLGAGAAAGLAAYGAGIGADYIAHIGNNIPVLTDAANAAGHISRAASGYLSGIGVPGGLSEHALALGTALATWFAYATGSSSAMNRKYRSSRLHEDPSALGSPEAELLGIRRIV